VRVLAFLQIDGFYLGALVDAKPMTVVHQEKRVLDRDSEAGKRGVHVGMPLAEAKAILSREGRFVAWEEEAFRTAQRAWIDVATEFTDALEPAGQHAAYVDLSGHPRPTEVAERLADALKNRLGHSVRIGVAGSRWVAREVALRGDPAGTAMLRPMRFVAPLPTTALPVPTGAVQRLTQLGYATVGEVAQLPLETLRAQFDELAYELKRMALGGGSAHVEPVFPMDCLAERFHFDGAPETIEILEAGLQEIAGKLGDVLRSEDASAKIVELFLEHEDGAIEIRRRVFSKPIAESKILVAALRLMLANLPERPLDAVRVRLCDIERSRRVQLGLDGERSRRDQIRSVEAAVANARTAYGDAAVLRASELKEHRWKQVRRAYSAVNGWAWG